AALLGVAAQRLQVARAVRFLGRLLGGAFFLLLAGAGRGRGLHAARSAETARPHLRDRGRSDEQRCRGGERARELTAGAAHATGPVWSGVGPHSSNSTPPVAAGCRKATMWPRAPGPGGSSISGTA